MSTLINVDSVSLSYGQHPLLDEVNFQVERGERVCLIGRNGAGKSSLLKIIDDVVVPDGGKILKDPSLKIARLTQDLELEPHLKVHNAVALGLKETQDLLDEYTKLSEDISANPKRFEELHHEIDVCDGWHLEQRVEDVLERLNLPADKLISELSGGWQRRVSLAKALVINPDLLLLDEPTNHLDITTIQWLEEQLLDFQGGILFITHDRSLLKRLATRILELDRGQLSSWPGDYENFLRRKDEQLHAEEMENKHFDKKLAEEEIWIRKGIKARRTRNEGRVRALKAMRAERAMRQEQQGKVKLQLNKTDDTGKLVVNAEHLMQRYDGKDLINDFSIKIVRGDRIGLLGPNGIGKTTLINILLGKLKPDSGTIKLGTKLEVVYFDQLHASLDLDKTVIENLADGRMSVKINGRDVHVISYLKDFLFLPDRVQAKVDTLSGGERNRLLLAKLFSKPSNVIVMDEPTNDLDIETLELLEELLTEFKGTLLLVSHDREFLDNIVSSTIAFEGNGKLQEYVGGYSDWLTQRQSTVATKPIEKSVKKPEVKPATSKSTLSHEERKELSKLPALIEKLEQRQAQQEAVIAEPDFYQQDENITKAELDKLKEIEKELEVTYERWDELEQKK